MKIETSRFGPLDVEETILIRFPWGVPGFEQIKRYVLLEHRQGPFQWLQAVDDPDLAFVVCEPQAMGVCYTVPKEKAEPLGIKDWQDLVILIMVSFDRGQKKIRPHLRGPLLFNAALRLAYQWSMDAGEAKKYLNALGEPALQPATPPDSI
jgi:flagellar assembly factor FliW